MPTPLNESPFTVALAVEVNVYDTGTHSEAVASVEAAIERVDDIRLDDGSIVRWEAPTFANSLPAATVEIDGAYGEPDGEIRLSDEHGEIVMWSSDEWIEDPSLVYVIAEALRIATTEGTDALRARINKPT